jgi:secernin
MCDTLCVQSGAGMIFAKNSDRPVHERQVVEWHDRRTAGGTLRTQYLSIDDTGAHALLGSRPTWLWGLEHGVNEYGVAVGNEKVWTVDDTRAQPAGLLGMDLVRLTVERSKSADQALTVLTELLETHGQGGSGEADRDRPYFSSFLIAAPDGGWVVETSARTWAARPVAQGTSISNRISIGTEWTRASLDVAPGVSFDSWRDARVPTAIADHRLSATRTAVASSAAPSPAEIAGVLRDHGRGSWGTVGDAPDRIDPPPHEPGDDGRGVTVCMHVGEHQVTTASLIAALGDGTVPPRAWACLGSPCVGVYVPVFAGASAPELADPAQWDRFEQLRRRVEQRPESLAEVRTALAPVEAQLWHEADGCFDTGALGPLSAFAGRAWKPVADALQTLGV